VDKATTGDTLIWNGVNEPTNTAIGEARRFATEIPSHSAGKDASAAVDFFGTGVADSTRCRVACREWQPHSS
jgi:hypothetical protein